MSVDYWTIHNPNPDHDLPKINKAIVDIRRCPRFCLMVSQFECTRPIRVAFARPIMNKHDVIHKTGSTRLIALSLEEDRATATIYTNRKFQL